METKKRILLYGNSVILGTIGLCLERNSAFEVTKLIPPLQDMQKFDASQTDIILFDMQTTHPEALLSLLGINSTLQLIGISSDINLINVWSTREMREVSMQDLLQVITS